MIASPPRSRTTSGRFFFGRSERDLGRGRHRGDMLGHLGMFAGLGQEAGDVEVGLLPRLVVDLALHGGEAGRIAGQPPEPLGLAVGEHPAGLGGDFRRCRRGAALRASPFALAVASRHGGLFRIQVHLHRRPPPGETSSPCCSSSRRLAMLADGALAVTAFWDQARLLVSLQMALLKAMLIDGCDDVTQ